MNNFNLYIYWLNKIKTYLFNKKLGFRPINQIIFINFWDY